MKRLDDIILKDQDRCAIEEAACLLRARLPVEQVILFGSKAREEDDAESDIDLLVVVRGEAGQKLRERVRDTLYPLEMERDAWFGLLTVPQDQWEHGVYQAMPIRHEIEREGVLVP